MGLLLSDYTYDPNHLNFTNGYFNLETNVFIADKNAALQKPNFGYDYIAWEEEEEEDHRLGNERSPTESSTKKDK